MPLPDPATIDCGNRLYASILTGRKLARPRHIYDVLPFGFELDLLEIRLYELEEVVDYHIFVESVRSQRGWRKPLLYSDSAQRYARFFPKLIPGILDERAIRAIGTNASVPKDKNYFTLEMMQRESARTLFRATFPNVTYNDMMVDWDTDMIPSGYLLWHVKHCELKKCKGFSAKIETYKNRLETCRNGGSHHAVYFVHRKSTTYLRINSPCVGAHFESYGSAAMLTCKYMGLAESWAFPINSYTSVEDKIWAIKNPQRQHEIELSHGSFLGAPHHPNKTEQCRVQDCGGRNFVPWVVANNPDRYPILMRNYDRSWLPAGRVTSNERFTTI